MVYLYDVAYPGLARGTARGGTTWRCDARSDMSHSTNADDAMMVVEAVGVEHIQTVEAAQFREAMSQLGAGAACRDDGRSGG